MGSNLQAAGKAARAARVALARRDSSVFVDLLFGVEGAGFQREWHRQCDAHDRLVLFAPVEHGKTLRLATGRAVWLLGKNPKAHGLIVGASAMSASKILSAIRQTIDENPVVREVFPDLRPAKGKYAKWTDEAIRVAGQDPGDKDFSLQAIGIGGSILGARLDFVIGDDLCTFETTATALQRQKVREWWTSTITGRLLPGATALILGNAWFPDDVMHWLVKEAGYTESRVEAYREREDGTVIEESILWPSQWSRARLEQRIRELGSVVEARRQMRCVAYASGSNQFDLEWFDRAFASASEMWPTAFEKILPRFLRDGYRGTWPVFTGVDLGVGRTEKNDLSCLFTIAVEPGTQRRHVIWVESGRWSGPQIIERIQGVFGKYGGRIFVENNAAQEFLLQWTREKGVPVEPITTGNLKADPRYGVPSLAQELAAGMWALPTEDELHKWRAQCLSYTPGQHAGDRLMASWFAREAARTAPYSEAAVVAPDNLRGSGTLRGRYDVRGRRSLSLLRRAS